MELSRFNKLINGVKFTAQYDKKTTIQLRLNVHGHFNYQLVGVTDDGTVFPYGIISKFAQYKFTINYDESGQIPCFYFDAPASIVHKVLSWVYAFASTPLKKRNTTDYIAPKQLEYELGQRKDERNDYLESRLDYLSDNMNVVDSEDDEASMDEDMDDSINSASDNKDDSATTANPMDEFWSALFNEAGIKSDRQSNKKKQDNDNNKQATKSPDVSVKLDGKELSPEDIRQFTKMFFDNMHDMF